PFDRGRWKLVAAVQAVVSVATSLLVMTLMVPVFMANAMPESEIHTPEDAFRRLFFGHYLFLLWVYWLIAGACYGVTYYRKYQERERRAAQLEAQLVQTQLQMLK